MILEKARELGIALSESEEYLRMRTARELLNQNEAVSEMIREYQDKQEQLLSILSGDQLDREVVATLSSDVEAMQKQLLENPLFHEFLQSQKEFEQMLSQVNHEIGACIGLAPAETYVSGCKGSCQGCTGCQQ